MSGRSDDAGAGSEPEAQAEPVEPAAGARPSEADPKVGQLLGGRYRVLERLAAGGMGTVYRAEHVGLQKEVAIKLVTEDGSGRPEHAQRFMREAMLTSRIDHPNVISATDYGTFDDGTAFLAMSLVSGPTLAQVMEAERPMSWLRAAEIGAQIADAIAAAQAQGIVHRDLKPANLVLQPLPGGGDAVKVLDFGIAKYTRDSLAPPAVQGVQQATRRGVVVGTPGYMAPEQAVGKRADHRADLYALGVLLWECVVGRKLWDFDDIQQLMAAQLNRRPPSVRAETGDDAIPEAFDALVASLLATRPEERPASASQARDVLRALVQGARASSVGGPEPPTKVLLVQSPRPPSVPGTETSVFRRHAPTQQVADAGPPELVTEPPRAAEEPAAGAPELAPEPLAVTLPPPRMRAAAHRARRRLQQRSVVVAGLALLALLALVGYRVWSSTTAAIARGPIDPTSTRPLRVEASPAPPVAPLPEAAARPIAQAEEASDPSPPQPVTATSVEPPPAPLVAAPQRRTTAPAAKVPPAGENADRLRATARAHFAQKDFRKAAETYRAATKEAPRHAGAHAGLAASELALGDVQAAITAYRRAVELSPATSGFHAALGRAYLVSGDKLRAIAAYRKAVALDPKNQTAFAALAQLAP